MAGARDVRAFVRRLGGNAATGVRRLAERAVVGRRTDRDTLWLLVRLRGDATELRPSRFSWSSEPRLPALVDLLRALEAARDDARVRGLVLRFEGGPATLVQAAALRRAVVALREAGKAVWAWSEAYDALELWVASACERVDVAPTGSVHLLGFRTAQVFARPLLERVGVRADVVRIGTHKAAAEPLTRAAMSPEQREQLEAWQRDAFDRLVDDVARGRSLAPDAVRAA
ncbi:MAG: S49 family peptidase, partial [Myxococcales bacterium]|nr:S49 family peptidase [Myxococcales bacterium]